MPYKDHNKEIERHKVYRENNRELIRERQRLWRKNNHERYLENSRNYKKEHPEKAKEWYIKNADKIKKRVKLNYLLNPLPKREYARIYKKNNPDKAKASEYKRRALKLGNDGSFTDVEWLNLKRQFNFSCVCCGKLESALINIHRKLVPDHIVSLSIGGSNHISNIQPLCHGLDGCNNHKGIKIIDYRLSFCEWMS